MQLPWLERYLRKSARARYGMPRLDRLMTPNPVRDTQTGFIHHPAAFPIEFRRLWLAEWLEPFEDEPDGIGVIFETDYYLKPGALVEIRIPLRHEKEKFHGRVVLVRNRGPALFEIGVWFPQRFDAARARIVEQVCHIETYLLQKRLSDGPYAFDSERHTADWVRDHAASVPTM